MGAEVKGVRVGCHPERNPENRDGAKDPLRLGEIPPPVPTRRGAQL